MINRRNFIIRTAALVSAVQFPALSLARTSATEFELIAGPARKKLFRPDAEASDVWAYNSEVPGPEIRVNKGDRIRVRFTNNLEEPTSVHWHGIRIDNAMDGVSGLTQEPVQPGASFLYDFEAPDAGTYWYHAHNKSWNEVGRGLYGPLIIDEPEKPFDDLHDITLVIDDWRLRQPGVLDTESFGSLMDWSHGGRLGNWITVNGEPAPAMVLKRGEAYRLRLINAANSRVFEIDPNRFDAKVLAYDGQALPEPINLGYAPAMLGPAQRMDLLVVPRESFVLEEVSSNDPLVMAEFKVEGDAAAAPATPPLTINAIPEPDIANAQRVKVVMEGGAMGGFVEITYQGKKLQREDVQSTRQTWAFNGVANLASDPQFVAERGQTIILETVNRTAWVHAMHVHGHHFRVISRSGSEVDEGEPWRDTFLIGPEQTTNIAFVADNPGKWLYHCHMLEHAAAGMTTWFTVA
tara:strand:+ start:968 stop:2359 length:1392 start_codon:yes stop_codon:yes gene_type:complete